jgi:peptidoglycan/xylan/chitin deacetylase (PgdA/CDA1 family)
MRQCARDAIRGRALIAGSDTQEIALTFDDGPNDPYTLQLLETLDLFKARATFFLIGTFVRKRPDIVRSIVQGGHLVGNHSMTHPSLLWERPGRIREQLLSCSRAIEDVAGVQVQYFRPPFWLRWRHVIEVARDLGLTSVMWNVTGYDWEPNTPEELRIRVQTGVEQNRLRGQGSNILLHDGGYEMFATDRSVTVEATRRMVEAWSNSGARLVTVAQFADITTGPSGLP